MVGAIGSKDYGDIAIFEVSAERTLYFDNFKRSNKISFAKNNVLFKKPVSEYIGQELDTISFEMYFRAELGTEPRDEVDKLIRIQRDGAPVSLILWGKAFGTYRWIIKDLDMAWETINKIGYVQGIKCSITLEEYCGEWRHEYDYYG